jgi:uncharacterized sulfatase
VHEGYAADVSFMDQTLGAISGALERLDLDEDTLVVVASDHGEALYDHGVLGHTDTTWEEQSRVLLLFRGAGLPRGSRVDAPGAHLADITPTILDLLGLEVPTEVTGSSLAECLRGGVCEPRRSWRAYNVDGDQKLATVALYGWPFKVQWLLRGAAESFRLDTDPRENRPLPEPPPGWGRHAHEVLQAQKALLERALQSPLSLSDEERRMLESLGYL